MAARDDDVLRADGGQAVQHPLCGAVLVVCGQVPGLVAAQPSRRSRARQGDELSAFDLGDSWFAFRPGPVAEAGQAFGVEGSSMLRGKFALMPLAR